MPIRAGRVFAAPTPLALVAASIILLALSASGNAFLATIAEDLMTWIGLAAALNIIMGFAGYVSFGHAVFMGLGGYVTALMLEQWLPGLASRHPVLVAGLGIVAAAAAAAALAGAVGLAVLRLRGAFFAIATIGLDLAAMYLAYMLPTEEGGGEVYISRDKIPGTSVIGVATWIVFLATIIVMIMVRRSKLGMGLEAIKEDEDAAESLGVPTFRYKTAAFMLSAALAGAMGAVYAWRTASVTPGESFSLAYSIKMIVIDVIGGLGTLLGPLVGGLVYYILGLAFSVNPLLMDAADMIMGVIAILIVLFLPEGIVGRLRRLEITIGGKPVSRILE